MTQYNKLWAALAIGAAFVALKYFNLAPAGFDQLTIEMLQIGLTAAGVYTFKNA